MGIGAYKERVLQQQLAAQRAASREAAFADLSRTMATVLGTERQHQQAMPGMEAQREQTRQSSDTYRRNMQDRDSYDAALAAMVPGAGDARFSRVLGAPDQSGRARMAPHQINTVREEQTPNFAPLDGEENYGPRMRNHLAGGRSGPSFADANLTGPFPPDSGMVFIDDGDVGGGASFRDVNLTGPFPPGSGMVVIDDSYVGGEAARPAQPSDVAMGPYLPTPEKAGILDLLVGPPSPQRASEADLAMGPHRPDPVPASAADMDMGPPAPAPAANRQASQDDISIEFGPLSFGDRDIDGAGQMSAPERRMLMAAAERAAGRAKMQPLDGMNLRRQQIGGLATADLPEAVATINEYSPGIGDLDPAERGRRIRMIRQMEQGFLPGRLQAHETGRDDFKAEQNAALEASKLALAGQLGNRRLDAQQAAAAAKASGGGGGDDNGLKYLDTIRKMTADTMAARLSGDVAAAFLKSGGELSQMDPAMAARALQEVPDFRQQHNALFQANVSRNQWAMSDRTRRKYLEYQRNIMGQQAAADAANAGKMDAAEKAAATKAAFELAKSKFKAQHRTGLGMAGEVGGEDEVKKAISELLAQSGLSGGDLEQAQYDAEDDVINWGNPAYYSYNDVLKAVEKAAKKAAKQ